MWKEAKDITPEKDGEYFVIVIDLKLWEKYAWTAHYIKDYDSWHIYNIENKCAVLYWMEIPEYGL